jgi:outer membrane protein assembly factor BamB
MKQRALYSCTIGILVLSISFLYMNIPEKKSEIKYVQRVRNMSNKNVINKRIFSDLQNRSYLPYSGAISDEEIWLVKASSIFLDQIPIHLSIYSKNLIACYGNGFASLSIFNGKERWTREITNHSSINIDEIGISIIDGNLFHRILDFNGELGKKITLPFLSNYIHLLYADLSDDLSFIIFNRYPGPSFPPESHGFVVSSFQNKNNKILWRYSFEENVNMLAVSSDNRKIYLSTNNKIYILPLNARFEKEIELLSFSNIISFSLNEKNDLLIIEKDDKLYFIKEIHIEGNTVWEVEIPDISTIQQSPALSPDGVVYYVAGKLLYCISNGEVLWTTELMPAPCDTYLTVLADNSVLVASMNVLYHFSSEGNILAKINNPFVITCRPIMDEMGNVYIAGRGWIRCLR